MEYETDCMWSNTWFISTSLGNVYCAGMNQNGQCGIKIEHESAYQYNLNCILQMIPIPNLVI